ncbi:hypothetical protein [Microbacterium sediminicola]
METDTISSVISAATSGITSELWLVAPIGLGIMAIVWGVPKGVRFLKSLGR